MGRPIHLALPICAKCKKPVGSLISWPLDPAQRVLRFTVECHGEVEESTLPLELLEEVRSVHDIQIGEAFLPRATIPARLHEKDLPGHVLTKSADYENLVLPHSTDA